MPFNYFDEFNGSPEFQFSPYGSSAVRRGIVPWGQTNSLLAYVFPTSGIPHAMPGFPGLLASSLSIVPLSGDMSKTHNSTSGTMGEGDLDTTNYPNDFALVTISYDTARVEILSGGGADPVPRLSHHISVGGQIIDSDSGGLEWAADGGEVDDNVNVATYIATIEHSITWHQVLSPPFAAIRNCIMTVNASALTFNTGVIAAGTALFTGAELERDVMSNGALAWRVTYRFSERRVPPAPDDTDFGGVGGWNHFWRSESKKKPNLEGKTGWYRLQFAGDRLNSGGSIFPSANHSTLFT